jgi:hypothetical protein
LMNTLSSRPEAASLVGTSTEGAMTLAFLATGFSSSDSELLLLLLLLLEEEEEAFLAATFLATGFSSSDSELLLLLLEEEEEDSALTGVFLVTIFLATGFSSSDSELLLELELLEEELELLELEDSATFFLESTDFLFSPILINKICNLKRNIMLVIFSFGTCSFWGYACCNVTCRFEWLQRFCIIKHVKTIHLTRAEICGR